MSSSINKPTGMGFTNAHRTCVDCRHSEVVHWNHACFRRLHQFSEEFCPCVGFTARDRDDAERAVLKQLQDEEKAKRSKVQYMGENWLKEFEQEFKRRRIKDLDD